MSNFTINKNTAFSMVMAICIYAILDRIIPPSVKPVFDLVMSKNATGITDIRQQRDIQLVKKISVDRIDLADKSRFRHAKIGDIGFGNDFFVDITSSFTVKQAGEYIFYLGSDDGFIFAIDGKELCSWANDRPLSKTPCKMNLNVGEHTFVLNYFQGYGNAGLIMSYAYAKDGEQYIAGTNSKYIEF